MRILELENRRFQGRYARFQFFSLGPREREDAVNV
jgi:hypothetical protein